MPTVFPPPVAITYTAFGLNLAGYLAQPGALFTVNQYGFDSGIRKYFVNKDLAVTDPFVIGTPDFQFPLMRVDRVTSESIGGPWSYVEINYLGVIAPKGIAYTLDSDIRSIDDGFGGLFTMGLATVQAIYITSIAPDMNAAGQPLAPDIFVDLPNPQPWNDYLASVGSPLHVNPIAYWVWILEKRSYRVSGTLPVYHGGVGGGGGGGLDFRQITGTIEWDLGNNSGTGTGTLFLTEIDVGNIIYDTISLGGNNYQLQTDHQWVVVEVVNDHHIFVSYNGVVGGGQHCGYVLVTGAKPGGGDGDPPSDALFEVTDSFKRVISFNGAYFFV